MAENRSEAEQRLATLCTPEHVDKVIKDLAGRWRKHADLYRTVKDDRLIGHELGAMHSYCKSIAVLMDMDYLQVEISLQKGLL